MAGSNKSSNSRTSKYIPVQLAADYLGISVSVLYRLTATRAIDYYKLSGDRGKRGGRIVFTYEILDRYMESKRIKAL